MITHDNICGTEEPDGLVHGVTESDKTETKQQTHDILYQKKKRAYFLKEEKDLVCILRMHFNIFSES